jgi:nonsense-mediated mRNA decay protein 3
LQRFCPKCGKETKNLIEGLCSDCFSEKAKVAAIPPQIDLKVCKKCLRAFFRGGMHPVDADLLREAALSRLKVKDAEITKVSVDFTEKEGYYLAELHLSLSKGGVPFKAKAKTELKERKFLCDSCMKLVSGYFEATIQLRGFPEEKKVMQDMRAFLKILGKKDELAAITAEERKREGTDIKIASLRAAKKVVAHLSAKYNASVTPSHSIAGYDRTRGKPKKRFTYCLRPK